MTVKDAVNPSNAGNGVASYLADDSYSQQREYRTIFSLIRHWAEDRNLVKGALPKDQMLKMVEELGELGKAVGKSDMPQIIDSIGDSVVVLTILAAQYGLTIEDCIASAYNEIKDRKGIMVNGIFVKEA